MRVLEIGSGAGDVALMLAELVGQDGQVVGVDVNSQKFLTPHATAQPKQVYGTLNLLLVMRERLILGINLTLLSDDLS